LQVTGRIQLIDKEIDKVIDLAISGPMLIDSIGLDWLFMSAHHSLHFRGDELLLTLRLAIFVYAK
jgi:hypothetical protein